MSSFVGHTGSPERSSLPENSPEATEKRKQRVMHVVTQNLPTLPTFLLDLNSLLQSPSVELKKVAKVIRTDPSLSVQILRLCNSPLFGLRKRVLSIEQAAVLLGTERLRNLVLACSMMRFASKGLPPALVASFWQHSFLAGLLSERIARSVDYFEKEQAYLAGLLHDIGGLPLWIVALEEQAKGRYLPPEHWFDDVAIERQYFGVDHCKVGRSMAMSWNLMPSFVDVFEFHHTPGRAQHDPYLAGIVAAADQFLISQPEPPAGESTAPPAALPPETHSEPPEFLRASLPLLSDTDRQSLFRMLQTEYFQLLPVVQIGISEITSCSPPPR